MQVILRSNFAKWTVTVLAVAGIFALLVWVSKTYVAELVAKQPTAENLLFASKLDPDNSSYHLRLGRLFQYSLSDFNLDSAAEHLKRATQLNPYDPQAWLDLGTALEFQGKTAEAEACLRHADFLAPNFPTFQYAIGNFFILQGNVHEAFHHLRVVLAGSSQYNQVIYNTAWKGSGDAKEILEQLIPNDIPVEFDYLYFLVAQKRYSEARSVWKRIVASPEKFAPSQAGPYIDDLIQAHMLQEAYESWTDLGSQGLISPTYQVSNQNLITNGDFEENPLDMGFDWRIGGVGGVDVGLDQSQYRSASHALLIQFQGNQNLEYRNVYEYVRVAPGRSYQLRGFMMTEGITTDSGPHLEVRDAFDPSALDKYSEPLPGSTAGWMELILEFTTGPKTELVVVAVARLPSRKFDNKIAGKVWLDDVSLRPRFGEPPLSKSSQ